MLTREQFLSAADLQPVRVDVPEFGEGAFVFVRGLTAGEREQWELAYLAADVDEREPRIRAGMVALATVTENGDKVFKAEDVEALASKSAGVIDRLYEKIRELSGLRKN